MNSRTHLFRYKSPLGIIGLELAGDVCHHIFLGNHDLPENVAECSPEHPTARWLDAYFRGKNPPLPPIVPAKTPFQEKMRQGLLAIPSGEVHTYGELAKRLNSAPRAVGQALGANPIPILIPCHRIVAADGLGGFACRLDWKRKLLTREESI